jgi:hypothetical protein
MRKKKSPKQIKLARVRLQFLTLEGEEEEQQQKKGRPAAVLDRRREDRLLS